MLGPVLFLIYINDIVDGLKCHDYLFADDMKIYNYIRSDTDASVLQTDLDQITKWTDKWLLQLSISKCKLMHLGRKDIVYSYHLNSNDKQQQLERSHAERDLGIIVDDKLKFVDHIFSKIKQANKMIGIIKRHFQYLDNGTLVKLYKAVVRSCVEYAQAVWSPHSKRLIEAIERVQKRATKIPHQMKKLSYPERLRKLQLPTLVYRRLRGDMIETYKLVHNLYDPEGTIHLTPYLGPTVRGHPLKLWKLQATLNGCKYSFTHRVVEIWNCLPEDVVTIVASISK